MNMQIIAICVSYINNFVCMFSEEMLYVEYLKGNDKDAVQHPWQFQMFYVQDLCFNFGKLYFLYN